MSQYKDKELKPRGWKIVVTSDETDDVIEEEIDDMLRKISNRVRMDLCFQMTQEEVDKMYTIELSDKEKENLIKEYETK